MLNLRILIVGNETSTQKGIHVLLKRLGYKTAECSSSILDVCAAIDEYRPDLLLVVVEPEILEDAILLARQMHEYALLPVLFWTKNSYQEILQKMKTEASFIHVVNPERERAIADEIEIAHFKHSAISALRAGEEKYRSIFRVAADLILTVDRRGVILDCNDRSKTMLGYEPEEIIGQDLAKILHPEDLSRARASWCEIPSTSSDRNRIYRLLKKDGVVVETCVNSAELTDRRGASIGTVCIFNDVTEINQTHKTLQEKEKRYQIVADQTGQLIYDYDVKTGAIQWFGAIAEITGYSSAQFASVNIDAWAELIHPEDRAEALNLLQEAQQRVGKYHVDYRFRRKNGKYIHIEDTGLFLPDETGKASRMLGSMKDITERVEAQNALRRSEERYRLLIENANEAIFVVKDRKICYCNPKLVEIMGYSAAELAAIPIDELIHEEDRALVVDRHLRRIRGESLPNIYDFRVRDKNQQVKWLRINAVKIEWEQKPATLNFAGEITQQKLAEEALRESEEKYSALVEHSTDGVFILQDDALQFANKALLNMTGYSFDEIRNHFDLLLVPEEREKVLSYYHNRISGMPAPSLYETRLLTKHGTILDVEISAGVIQYRGRPASMGIIRDITQRKLTAEIIRESEKKYRTLYETMSLGIVHQNARGEIVSANPAAEQIFGLTFEQMQWRTSLDPRWRAIREDGNDFPGPEHPAMVALTTGSRVQDVVMGVYNPRLESYRWIRIDATPLFKPGQEKPEGVYTIFKDITEEKAAKAQLEENEKKYRTLFSSANDAIFLMKEDVFVDCNEKTLEMFGCTRDQILGHTPYEFSPATQPDGRDSREKALELIQSVLQGESRHFYWKHRRPDGTLFDTEVSLNVVEVGQDRQLQAIVRDVTERMKTEEALRLNEELLAATLESTADGILVVDDRGRVTHYNSRFAQIWGIPDEILATRDDDQLLAFVLEQLEEPRSFLEKVKQTYQSDDETYDLIKFKNGQILERYSSPLRRNGKNAGRVWNFRDVTERKEREAALRESEDRLKTIFNAFDAGVLIIDPETHVIVDANRTAAEMIGNPIEKIVGVRCHKFICPNEVGQCPVTDLGESVDHSECLLTRSDGGILPILKTVVRIILNGKPCLLESFIDISQKKRAEEALQASEQRYRLLFERNLAGVYRTTPAGKILDCNDAFAKIFGYASREEALQLMAHDLYEKQAERAAFLAQLYEKSSITNLEQKLKRRDGSDVWVLENVSLIEEESGELEILEGTLIDITDLKRTALALQENQRALTTLMSNLPGMAYRCKNERNWEMEYVSQGCFELTGYGPEEIMEGGKITYGDIIVPDDRDTVWNAVQKALQNKTNYRMTYRIKTASGEEKWVWEQGQGVFAENGELQALEGFIADITEQKRAETALQQSEERFRLLVENQGEGVCIIDLEENFTFANPAAEKLFGVEPGGLFQRNLREFLSEEDFQRVRRHTATRYAGVRSNYELNILRKDGEKRTLIITATPMMDDRSELTGVLGVFRDITETKKVEAALAREAEVNAILAEISRALLRSAPIEEISDMIYSHALHLTGSRLGFVGYLDAQSGFLVAPTMTQGVWDQCRVEGKEKIFKHFEGLWGWVLKNCKPILTNQPAQDPRASGTPEGHIPIERFLSVPAFIGGTLVGQIALANPDRDYTDEDLQVLERLASLYAVAIQRWRDEEALRQSELKYRILVDNMQDGVFILQDDKFVFANEALIRMVGYMPEEVTGLEFWKTIAPEDREMVVDRHRRRKAGEDIPREYEFRALHKDQTTRVFVRMTINEIEYQGQPAYMGTIRNITRQKYAEREKEAILNVNRLLLGELDPERALRGISAELKELVPHRMLALSLIQKEKDQMDLVMVAAEEGSDLDGFMEVPGEYFETYKGSLTQQILHDKRNRIQAYIPETGTTFERNLRQLGMRSYIAAPLVNGGVPLGMLYLAADQPAVYTQRHETLLEQIQSQLALFIQHHRLIERVLDSEAKFRNLFDNSNDAIYILQGKRFVYVNKKFEELLGYTLEEVNRPDFDFIKLVAPDSVPLIEERARRSAAGEKLSPNYEFQGLSKSGEILDFDVSVNYTTYEGKPAVQGILRNITERKRLEARQKEMQMEIMQHAKLSSIGMLAAGIGHNLNVPLQGIINHIELLKMTQDNIPYLDDILNQAQRISAIINNMLYKSRQEQDLEKRPIDLNQLLVEELKFLNADLVFKHRIKKEYQFDPNLPMVQGVYGDFSQSLLNIIKNAIDAMHDTPEKKLSVKTEACSDGKILIEIRDTGCGIPPEYQERIFDPFFTTKPVNGKQKGDEPSGTGLGLSSAYQLLKKYDARFEVLSRPGEGTIFRVYIPYKTENAPSADSTAEASGDQEPAEEIPETVEP